MKKDKKKIIKKSIFFGVILGSTIGVSIPFIFILGLSLISFENRQFFYHTLGAPGVLLEGIARKLNLCSGMGCIGPNLIGEILIYSLLGIFVTFLVLKYKQKRGR